MTRHRFKQHACRMVQLPARFAGATPVCGDALFFDGPLSDRLPLACMPENCNLLERSVLRVRARI